MKKQLLFGLLSMTYCGVTLYGGSGKTVKSFDEPKEQKTVKVKPGFSIEGITKKTPSSFEAIGKGSKTYADYSYKLPSGETETKRVDAFQVTLDKKTAKFEGEASLKEQERIKDLIARKQEESRSSEAELKMTAKTQKELETKVQQRVKELLKDQPKGLSKEEQAKASEVARSQAISELGRTDQMLLKTPKPLTKAEKKEVDTVLKDAAAAQVEAENDVRVERFGKFITELGNDQTLKNDPAFQKRLSKLQGGKFSDAAEKEVESLAARMLYAKAKAAGVPGSETLPPYKSNDDDVAIAKNLDALNQAQSETE